MKRSVLILFSCALMVAAQASSRAAEPDVRLVRAAKINDSAAVRQLIRQKANVNAPDGDGSTALLWAAHWEAIDDARALVLAGANARAANRLGVTPLLEASRLGNAALIELLLKAGAPADETHIDGETALMASSGAGSVDAVRLLIKSGANVNATEEWQGETALMWAAAEGHLDVVNVLVEAGAQLNIVGKPSLLTHHGNTGGGRGFTDHASRGLTAVMLAAREGHTDVVRRLVDAGADLKHANPDGVTALSIAIINSRFDLAAMLLEKGADANDGSLYQAIEMHNLAPVVTTGDATRPRLVHDNTLTALDLIGRLLDRGADPNKVVTGSLHFAGASRPPVINASSIARAAQVNDVAAIKLMLAKGANVNVSDPVIPGAAAATAGGFGAAANNAGLTPLMVIAGGGGGGARAFGGGGGRAGGPQFRELSDRTAVGAATALLEAPGTDVNAAGANGDTALHRAAQSGNVAMIQLLADHGAKFDVANQAGLTPLDIAMGKSARPAPAAAAAGGGLGRAAAPAGGPQPASITLLRKLMNLPPLSPADMPQVAPPPATPLGN